MNFRRILPIFLLVFLSACDAFWGLVLGEEAVKQPVIQSVPPVKQAKPSIQKTDPGFRSDLERDVTCRDYIRDQKQFSSIKFPDQDTLALELDSNRVFDETSLAKWAADLSQILFVDRDCLWQKIVFLAAVDDISFYQGEIHKSDYLLFQEGRISKPEWFRRFEIHKMDTDKSLKAQLKMARENGELKKAEELLSQLLVTEPHHLELNIIKNNLALEQGALHEALAGFEALHERFPDNMRILYNLAYTQKELGRFTDAIGYYKKLSQLSGNLPGFTSEDVSWHLVDAYLKNQQLDEAQKVLEIFAAKHKEMYRIYRANLLRAQQNYAEAQKILQEMVDLGQDTPLVLFNLTLLHLDLQDVQGAREVYSMLQDKDPALAGELAFLPVFKKEQGETNPVVKTPVATPSKEDGPVPPVFGDEEDSGGPLF